MSEEGTLSIVRRGSGYQVRYASNNPYDPERPLHACPCICSHDTGSSTGFVLCGQMTPRRVYLRDIQNLTF